MSHYYEILPNFEAKFLEEVTTGPQARKHSSVCAASVTTKLKYEPNEFLERWARKQCIKLSKENPGKTEDEIMDLAWGVREHPNGTTVPSSDFGTELHKEFENATMAYHQGLNYRSKWFQEWTDLWVDWLSKHKAEVEGVELLVGDATRRTAGAIDQLLSIDGKMVLADFKTRVAGGSALSSKHYSKDCMQLAVEADIVRMKYNLDYMPRIYTIIVECTKPDMYVKLWTLPAQEKGLAKFDVINDFYNKLNDL